MAEKVSSRGRVLRKRNFEIRDDQDDEQPPTTNEAMSMTTEDVPPTPSSSKKESGKHKRDVDKLVEQEADEQEVEQEKPKDNKRKKPVSNSEQAERLKKEKQCKYRRGLYFSIPLEVRGTSPLGRCIYFTQVVFIKRASARIKYVIVKEGDILVDLQQKRWDVVLIHQSEAGQPIFHCLDLQSNNNNNKLVDVTMEGIVEVMFTEHVSEAHKVISEEKYAKKVAKYLTAKKKDKPASKKARVIHDEGLSKVD